MPDKDSAGDALLTQFQAMLQKDDAMVEFWYDPDAKIFWAGEAMGDTVHQALDRLIKGETFA